jgi:hypothetical protein
MNGAIIGQLIATVKLACISPRENGSIAANMMNVAGMN